MAKKSIIMNGWSSVTDPHVLSFEKMRYGNEQLNNNTNLIVNAVTVSKDKTPFDPKAIDMNEWCPVYEIGKNADGGNVYLCSISAGIVFTHEYVGLLNCLYNATDKDIVELNISSPGGYISAATQICAAIQQSKAEVYTHATGICASAGSLIWSVGDQVSVGDTANFMWHMSSHFDMGNSLSIADEADFQVNYVKNILLNVALKRGFVTEDEVATICNDPDRDVWVSAGEMRNRIEDFTKREVLPGEGD